jgi:DNA-binding FadR family transcriptional regulator
MPPEADGPPKDTPSRPGVDLAAPPLAAIRRLSAFDTVRVRIALAVDLGLLAPGERLPPTSDIAGALDVGEMTVRRALVSLCHDGILERRRGRTGGTLVAPRPPRGVVREIAAYRDAAGEVHRLIDHRVLLECGAAHLAATRAGTAELQRLRELVEQMEEVTAWTDFHRLDEQFHLAVASATGLSGVVEEYGAVLHELYRYYLPYPLEYLRESNGEHRALVDAVAERNPIAAVDVARRHVEVLHQTMFVGLLGDRLE